MDETVADEIIPDEVLRKALFEKAGGNTYGDLIALSGELDLSGLEIQDLTGMYPVSYTHLKLGIIFVELVQFSLFFPVGYCIFSGLAVK